MRYSEYFIYNKLLSIMPIDFRTKFRNTCRIMKYNLNIIRMHLFIMESHFFSSVVLIL